MKFRNMEKEKYRDYVYVTPEIEGSKIIDEKSQPLKTPSNSIKKNKMFLLDKLIQFFKKFFNK